MIEIFESDIITVVVFYACFADRRALEVFGDVVEGIAVVGRFLNLYYPFFMIVEIKPRIESGVIFYMTE